VLSSPDIDAIAVITPVWTHFDLAKEALLNGKHVFVEKPFTATSAQAEELIELAERNNLRIMVDHTFLFTGAVRKIRHCRRQCLATLSTAPVKRKVWSTMMRRLFLSASSINSSACADVAVKGFSTKTCLPLRSASLARSK